MMWPRILASAVAALLLLLAHLLIQGTSPEAARHERATALRELMLNEAALQRDVLQARAGLLRNYDPIVRSVASLRAAADELRVAGRQAGGETRATIDRHTQSLALAVGEQEALVERFKSSNAVLQNSLSFFMHASRQLRSTVSDGAATAGGAATTSGAAAAMEALAQAMLQLTAEPQGDAGRQVTAALGRLGAVPVADNAREIISGLDAHGRLIVAALPVVDALVSGVLAAPIAERATALQNVYLDVHTRALERARLFRTLLYVAAALLAAYVGYLFFCLHRNARALRARVDFERLIGAISTHFINLPADAIDDGIGRGLARLAAHMGVDRAQIVLLGHRAGSVEPYRFWSRAALPQATRAATMDWCLPGYERHGCTHVPDAATLPDSPERLCLRELGVRSFLRAPMWYAGKRVGFLVLDTMQAARHWPDDDIALVRMAGEIFATAIERKRSLSEREGLKARLHDAQRLQAIGTLAGGIAHEFNNILGAILGHCEMALAALTHGRPARRNVEQAMKAGQRAATVIDQVLTFSRRRERQHRSVVVEPVVSEAIDLLRASLPATIDIRADLEPGDTRIEADPAQLQQVVMNLCANAAQAMDGRGTVSITLEPVDASAERPLSHGTLARGRHIRLAVTDTGQGIDGATMQRMFEPFFTTKAAGSGTGLGLPTVHGIITAHQGAIHVESALGAGTRFEVYLPRTEAPAAGAEEQVAEVPPGHGETVLLVDDEKSLVLLGEEMLAALGYEPVGYDSSTAALAAFRADPRRFDLVLTDEVMPGMTGSELAQAVHRLRPELPIVLMTGHAKPQVDRARAGIREVIRKPLLSTTIAHCLARQLAVPA